MSWKSAGKTVIKLPLRVERRAAKRLEAQKLKALQESGTAYPKGNRDLPPIISCRRPELNHYFGQKYNPYTGKLPLASEHWPSRRSIGDYFSFGAFRGPPATQWHKILQRKLFLLLQNFSRMFFYKEKYFYSYRTFPELYKHCDNFNVKSFL